MKTDIAFFLLSIIYYIAEYKIIKTHLYPADILFAGYGLYRLIYGLTRDKKAYTTKRLQMLTNAGMIFVPFAYLVNFALIRAGFDLSIISVLAIMFIIFLVIIASTPRLYLSHRKITLEEHQTKIEDVKREPFSLYLTSTIFIPGHQRFRHLEMIGLTGAGKTRYGIYPAIFQDVVNGAGVFIYDIKSDMQNDIKKYVSYANRDYDLMIYTLGNPDGETYNPLANGSPPEISGRVFTTFFPPTEISNEFYKGKAKVFLDCIVALLKRKYPVITFKDLYLLLLHPLTLLKTLCLEVPDTLEAQTLLQELSEEKLDQNISGLRLKIGQFVLPDWAKQINTTQPDIRMDKLLVDNKILLFQASSGKYQADYKPISILALKDIQTEIARRYDSKPEKPFFIYLDEFYNVIYPDFGEMINKARSAKVGLILAHQSIGDLERCGEEIRNIIIDNTVHKLIFKVGTPETAEFYAKLLGTRLVKKQVESHKDDGKVAGFTDKEEREFLIDPDTIKNLKTDSENDTAEAILIIETNKGRLFGKYTLDSIQVDFTGHTLLPKPTNKKQGLDTNLGAYLHLTERKGSNYFKNTTEVISDKETTDIKEKPAKPHTYKKRKGTLSAFDLIKKAEAANDNKDEKVEDNQDEKE
jgi:hypothetical protein